MLPKSIKITVWKAYIDQNSGGIVMGDIGYKCSQKAALSLSSMTPGADYNVVAVQNGHTLVWVTQREANLHGLREVPVPPGIPQHNPLDDYDTQTLKAEIARREEACA